MPSYGLYFAGHCFFIDFESTLGVCLVESFETFVGVSVAEGCFFVGFGGGIDSVLFDGGLDAGVEVGNGGLHFVGEVGSGLLHSE